jgi:glycosyltransferase involved in cell wall biosynthesis
MKVAIVYDWSNQIGGAERILADLHTIWPEAPLFTSVWDKNKASWSEKFPEIKTSFLQKIPFAKKHYRFFAPLIPVAFEQFNFDKFDVVISITSWPAKAIITKPQTCHICYCLTPPRSFWERKFLKHKLFFPFLAPFRAFDYFYSRRPDYFLTISQTAAERIKRFYQREAKVIYPGMKVCPELEQFRVKRNYFLAVGRMVYYKRFDILVDAFNNLGWPLKIVGEGPERKVLEKRAKKNIEFLGQISEKELQKLYTKAKAVICPQEEDFGLVSLEAQSFGAPVVAFAKGGLTETIIKGKTGEFFHRQNSASLIKVLREVKTKKYDAVDFLKNLRRFDKKKFLLQFKETAESLWWQNQKKKSILQ